MIYILYLSSYVVITADPGSKGFLKQLPNKQTAMIIIVAILIFVSWDKIQGKFIDTAEKTVVIAKEVNRDLFVSDARKHAITTCVAAFRTQKISSESVKIIGDISTGGYAPSRHEPIGEPNVTVTGDGKYTLVFWLTTVDLEPETRSQGTCYVEKGVIKAISIYEKP